MWKPTVENCDTYLNGRTGSYEYRRVRYKAVVAAMVKNGLSNLDTIFDLGAGWTEFDYYLRAEADWQGRYVPVDGWIDGTDLNNWVPPRTAEWFVALEIIEHLQFPLLFLDDVKPYARKGIVVSTPNPATVDVIGMDPTHVTEVWASELSGSGFSVTTESFYGKNKDSLFGVWLVGS